MNQLFKKVLILRDEGVSLAEILQKICPCPGAAHGDNLLFKHFDEIRWNSLDINYHPPRVERLWTQIGNMRLMVHRIHSVKGKDKKALFHPHPWPSAVYILSGMYEMGIGYGEGPEPPPVAATVLLTNGSSYSMDDKNGWHYVAPLAQEGMSLSVMLIDSPWETPHPFYLQDTYEKMRLDPLKETDRASLVEAVKWSLCH